VGRPHQWGPDPCKRPRLISFGMTQCVSTPFCTREKSKELCVDVPSHRTCSRMPKNENDFFISPQDSEININLIRFSKVATIRFTTFNCWPRDMHKTISKRCRN
jgi:hypothetical protein